MPLTGEEVAALVRDRVTFACAACEHYHEGIDRGQDGCGKETCGGPRTTGRAFPDYKGPVTQWRNVCWVCGQEAKIGLHIVGTERILGACEEHRNVHQGDSGRQTVVVVG